MNKDFIKSFWHELYLEMQSSPTDNRTDRQFCLDVQIHPNTLCLWKRTHRKDIFHEVGRRRGQYVDELRATAWKALADRMPNDTSAIKLAFQLLGDLVEKSQVTTEHMSRKDILDRANSLLGEFNAKKKTWEKVQNAESGVTADKVNSDKLDGALGNEPGKDSNSSGDVQPPVEPK